MSKAKGFKIEIELEKLRVEHQWEKLQDVIVQHSNQIHISFQQLLLGEIYLERWIDSLPVYPRPNPANKQALQKAKKCLRSALEQDVQKHELESHLLIAKCYYFSAKFDAALDHIEKAKLDEVNATQQTLRVLKLIAEAYAIKGLSLERQPLIIHSKYQKSVRNEHVVACFQKASELVLVYLKEIEKERFDSAVATGGAGSSSGASGGGDVVRLQVPSGSGSAASNASVTPSASISAATSLPGTGSSVALMLQQQSIFGYGGRLNDILEMAVQRVPIAMIHVHALEAGLDHYRLLLKSLDCRTSQGLQMTIARQLAELLLRGVPDGRFYAPTIPTAKLSSHQQQINNNQVQFYLEPQTFKPENRWEESLLVLFLANSIACREAVLSRSEEHSHIREESLFQVKAIQNLLIVALSMLSQHHLIPDILERTLKFVWNDFNLYQQLALAHYCQLKYARSLYFLNECIEMHQHDDYQSCMFSAKICIETLSRYSDGIALAQKAFELMSDGCWLKGRAKILMGLGHSMMAQQLPSYEERCANELKAQESFKDAIAFDPQDNLAWFFLALQLAMRRQLDEAQAMCEKSLALCANDHAPSILLLALLLTARKSYKEALNLVEVGLENFPNHFGLTVLRMKLELKLNRQDQALLSAKDLLLFWKRQTFFSPTQIHSNSSPDADQTSVSGVMDIASSSGRGTKIHTPMSTVGASSTVITPSGIASTDIVERESAAAAVSVTGGPHSDYGGAAATSISDSLQFTGTGLGGGASASIQRNAQHVWRLYANVWLELGEMFLQTGRLQDVVQCVEQAQQAFPSSHQALYLKGRVKECQGFVAVAKHCFIAALSICPYHTPSMRHLALQYRFEGNLEMADKVLRDLVKTSPLDYLSWRLLGTVLSEKSRFDDAKQCFDISLNLEQTAPLLPYAVIPRAMHV